MIARTAAPRSLLPALTGARILALPAVMALILSGPNHGSAYTAAAIVFAVAASTDFVDGYLARRWAVTTRLGSFLDTTADKLLVSGALIALVDVNRASPWIAAIIVGRELLILGLRGVVAADGTVFPPSIRRSGASSRRTSSSSPSSWRSSTTTTSSDRCASTSGR